MAGKWNEHIAYDGLIHNSNAFIGQIIRTAGGTLEFPQAVEPALAFGND